MYEIVSSVSAGIEMSARREREGPEKVIQVFGVQEWFRREEDRERERPRGSRVGVVRVWVFIRTYWGDDLLLFKYDGEIEEEVESEGRRVGVGSGTRKCRQAIENFVELTLAVISCTNDIGSFVREYDIAAWLIKSIVCHVVKPSSFFSCCR